LWIFQSNHPLPSIASRCKHRLALQSLSRAEHDRSLSPTRSAQTPSVANPLRHRNGEPCTAKTLQRRTSRARQDNPAFTGLPEGRPTHLLAKGNAIRCTQGAFHRRASLKGRAPRRCPPFPAWQPLWRRRLFNPTCSPARHRRGTARIRPHRWRLSPEGDFPPISAHEQKLAGRCAPQRPHRLLRSARSAARCTTL
jgi:hypothetical protein